MHTPWLQVISTLSGSRRGGIKYIELIENKTKQNPQLKGAFVGKELQIKAQKFFENICVPGYITLCATCRGVS